MVNSSTETQIAPPQLALPRHYRVLMLNDDETTMDFVIRVLTNIFAMELSRAEQVMWTIHRQGSAVCGVYPKDIAETKVERVHDLARVNGFPLRCKVEPE